MQYTYVRMNMNLASVYFRRFRTVLRAENLNIIRKYQILYVCQYIHPQKTYACRHYAAIYEISNNMHKWHAVNVEHSNIMRKYRDNYIY